MSNYKLFDHTADIGVEISGRTKKELFVNAADTLFDVMVEDNAGGEKIIRAKRRTLAVEGSDLPDLLINFLREVLYLFNGEHFVVNRCDITEIGNKKLTARLFMEPFSKRAHRIKTEIKAVTYYGVKVEKQKNNWKARVIFDV